VVKNFPEPYVVPPYGWFSLTGYSNENPNYCREYLYFSASPSRIELRTYFYFLKEYNKWAPVDPNLIKKEYTVLGPKPINKPLYLQAKPIEPTKIRLTWEDKSYNELWFRIYRSTNEQGPFESYDSVPRNQEFYDDEGVTIGQRYWYKVKAVAQWLESEFSNTATAMGGLSVPPRPWLEPVLFSAAHLHWEDNSPASNKFRIYRKIDEGPWEKIGETGVDETEFTDDELSNFWNQKVYYRITAFLGDLETDPSHSVGFVPPVIITDNSLAIGNWEGFGHGSRQLAKDGRYRFHLVLIHHDSLWYTTQDKFGRWRPAIGLPSTSPRQDLDSIYSVAVSLRSNRLPCFIWVEKQEGDKVIINYCYQKDDHTMSDRFEIPLGWGLEHNISPTLSRLLRMIGFLSPIG